MKRVLTILLISGLFAITIVSFAYAEDPGIKDPGAGDDVSAKPDTYIEFPIDTPSDDVFLPNNDGYNSLTPQNQIDEEGDGAIPGSATSGASLWSYQDDSDTNAKFEGSYRSFGPHDEDQDKNLYDANDNTVNNRETADDPHGGYGTTSNKCKTCHAVHRAQGAFALLRVNNPDESCSYCHIGDHRHSVVSAYWQDTENGIYASNGHTIGSGKIIPDSSIKQWTEEETLDSKSLNEPSAQIINVRRYDKNRNRIMRYIVHNDRFIRVGPNYLRCASCHQVHNAILQVWKPWKSTDSTITGGTTPNSSNSWTDGYKLLRNSPSGGIKRLSTMMNKTANFDFADSTPADNGYYDPEIDTGAIDPTGEDITGLIDVTGATGTPGSLLDATKTVDFYKEKDVYRLKAIDSTFTDTTNQGVTAGVVTDMEAGAGSPGTTGYTKWRFRGSGLEYSSFNNQIVVDETSMSFWCADCHNLNIAGLDQVETNWGIGKRNFVMLSDRSHPVPNNIITGSQTARGSHCQSCHNSDMPYIYMQDAGGIKEFKLQGVNLSYTATSMCSNCHITPVQYRLYKQTYRTFSGEEGGNSLSDWPHAGNPKGYKLLNYAEPKDSVTDEDLGGSVGFEDEPDGAIDTSLPPDGVLDTYTWDSDNHTTPTGNDKTYLPFDASKVNANDGADYREPYIHGVDGLDKICKICHGPVSGRNIGVQK